jgi:hypothetical protein
LDSIVKHILISIGPDIQLHKILYIIT